MVAPEGGPFFFCPVHGLPRPGYASSDSFAVLWSGQKGVFAAGDSIQKKYRQVTTAVADGTIAALNAVEYLNQKEKETTLV